MNSRSLKINLKALCVVAVAAALVIPALHLGLSVNAAGSATMSLSPSSGSYQTGSTLTVNVYENSGSEPVNAVQANLSYPDNLLDFTDISSSSAFPIAAESTGGGGSVRIARGAITPVTGNQLVATVRFSVAASGTASITFASGSAVIAVNGNTNILSDTNGGSYTLTSPSSTPPPSNPPPSNPPPSGNSTPSSNPKPSSSPGTANNNSGSTTANSTALTISDIGVSNLTGNTATISWKTSTSASSEVNYGLDTNYGVTAAAEGKTTDHYVVLDSKFLIPGTAYHFVVKSVDAAGNAATGPDTTFRTKGATLNVTVVNQENKLVKGAQVEIAGVTAESDSNGQAQLADLPFGQQTVKITYKGKTTESTVDIQPIEEGGQVQSATLKVTVDDELPLIVIIPAAGAGLLLLIGGAFLIHLMRKKIAADKELARHIAVPYSSGSGAPTAPTSGVITPGSSGITDEPNTGTIYPNPKK